MPRLRVRGKGEITRGKGHPAGGRDGPHGGLDLWRRSAAPGDAIIVREVSSLPLPPSFHPLVPTCTSHWPNPTKVSCTGSLQASASCQEPRLEGGEN